MNVEERNVRSIIADPTGLGLFGLGVVTLVAASQKLGITTGVSFIVPWAIFLGSIAQFVACIVDFKKNNVFGATAFGAFAMFWLAVGMSWTISTGAFGPELAANADPLQLAFAFLAYLIFVLFMTVAAVETNTLLFTIMIFVDVLLVALTLGAFGIAPDAMMLLGGVAEFLVALSSFYGCAAVVLNNQFGRTFLPVGKPFGIFKKQ